MRWLIQTSVGRVTGGLLGMLVGGGLMLASPLVFGVATVVTSLAASMVPLGFVVLAGSIVAGLLTRQQDIARHGAIVGAGILGSGLLLTLIGGLLKALAAVFSIGGGGLLVGGGILAAYEAVKLLRNPPSPNQEEITVTAEPVPATEFEQARMLRQRNELWDVLSEILEEPKARVPEELRKWGIEVIERAQDEEAEARTRRTFEL